MKFILFSGLPGIGKSLLAESIGCQLGIPVFAKDWLEATLLRSGIDSENSSIQLGSISYELLTVLAERQLVLQQSVILDSVAPTESIRTTWRNLAKKYKAQWLVIECICSNESIHQDRLEQRHRGIPDWHELEWPEVEHVKSYYAPWIEDRLVLDAVSGFEQNLLSALDYCK